MENEGTRLLVLTFLPARSDIIPHEGGDVGRTSLRAIATGFGDPRRNSSHLGARSHP